MSHPEPPALPPLPPGFDASSQQNPSEPPILGLDNVRLDLSFAGIGSRGLAAAVDYFLLSVFQLVWLFGGVALLGFFFGTSGGWTFAILTFGIFFLQWGFFAGFEIATGGQTPGKQLLGLRVVAEQGGQASRMAILIRNLLRTFDVLIGLPVMMFEPRARRLGDLVAGTAVIHPSADPESEVRLTRLPESWSPREIALAETFLRRAEHLAPERAQELAGALLRLIEVQQPDFLPEPLSDSGHDFDRLELLKRALAVR